MAQPFGLMSTNQFKAKKTNHSWLIEEILVTNQPGVIGGPPKCHKTSIVVDAAISIASGKPFLGRFRVPRRRKVAVFSGESGEATLKETAIRICESKELNFDDKEVLVSWSFRLPALGLKNDMKNLNQLIKEEKINVVFIDPLYLCLKGNQPISPSNVYEVGQALLYFTRACLTAGATPFLLHHSTKDKAKVSKGQLGLHDLAYSGISEFARQWLILNRTREFDPEEGISHLKMNVGGSAGHSRTFDLKIEEGRLDESFEGRYWKPELGGTKKHSFDDFED